MSRGQNRSARSQPERLDEVARVGDLHLHFFARAEPAGLQFLHILRLVDQQDVLVSGGLGFEEIRRLCNGGGDEPVADEAVLLRREDMAPDGEVVGVAIYEFEREHGDNPHTARSKGWAKSSYHTRQKPQPAVSRWRSVVLKRALSNLTPQRKCPAVDRQRRKTAGLFRSPGRWCGRRDHRPSYGNDGSFRRVCGSAGSG